MALTHLSCHHPHPPEWSPASTSVHQSPQEVPAQPDSDLSHCCSNPQWSLVLLTVEAVSTPLACSLPIPLLASSIFLPPCILESSMFLEHVTLPSVCPSLCLEFFPYVSRVHKSPLSHLCSNGNVPGSPSLAFCHFYIHDTFSKPN